MFPLYTVASIGVQGVQTRLNVLIGSEQEHDRKEGRRVPALAVAQVDFHALHALPVTLILPEHTGEIPDQRFQAGHQALVMGK